MYITRYYGKDNQEGKQNEEGKKEQKKWGWWLFWMMSVTIGVYVLVAVTHVTNYI